MAQVGDVSCSQSGCVRNFDINRLPSGDEEEEELEEEGGSSSAVSIVSPFLSPFSNTNQHDQNDPNDVYTTTTTTTTAPIDVYTAPANREEEEEGDVNGVPPRKKLRLSKEQSALLEESFREHHTLNPKQKSVLAKQLNLKSRQVEVWFQNRRARTKLKQTEVDCEFLKRCCESLTEENRRLQREVEELRAIKVAPPACLITAQDLYMPMPMQMQMPMPMPLPAATLTMCPSCERMGTTIDKRALTFTKPSHSHSYYVTNLRQPSAAC